MSDKLFIGFVYFLLAGSILFFAMDLNFTTNDCGQEMLQEMKNGTYKDLDEIDVCREAFAKNKVASDIMNH